MSAQTTNPTAPSDGAILSSDSSNRPRFANTAGSFAFSPGGSNVVMTTPSINVTLAGVNESYSDTTHTTRSFLNANQTTTLYSTFGHQAGQSINMVANGTSGSTAGPANAFPAGMCGFYASGYTAGFTMQSVDGPIYLTLANGANGYVNFASGGFTLNNANFVVATAGKGVRYGTSGPIDTYGSGTPEGSVSANVGSTYRRTDGGTGTSFYVKESGTGNTGWVAK